jgi:hypothetical protein
MVRRVPPHRLTGGGTEQREPHVVLGLEHDLQLHPDRQVPLRAVDNVGGQAHLGLLL